MKRLKVYLDNCCYNRPYDDQTQITVNLESLAKLRIQNEIRDHKIDLASSYILIAENAANRFEGKRIDIKSFIDRYTQTYVSEISKAKVMEIAEDIMKTGIKLMDACHVACSIIAGCDYFITTDRRLLRYNSDMVKIINPVNYVMEAEQEAEE